MDDSFINQGIYRPELPYNLTVEISTKCNLKCIMCPLTTGRTLSSVHPGNMTSDIWRRVVKTAKKVGQIMVVGYGEALMHPNCITWLKELSHLNVQMSLSTNGVLLTRDISKALMRIGNLSHCNISVDTDSEAFYRKVRGGRYQQAIKGIRNLVSVCDTPEKITVSAILMKDNLANLPGLIRTLSEIGVVNLELQNLKIFNPEMAKQQIHHLKDVAEKVECIKASAQEHHINLHIDVTDSVDLLLKDRTEYWKTFLKPEKDKALTKACCVPWEVPFINKDGNVFPCSNTVVDPAYIMGNLKTDDFEEIWHNRKFRKFRRDLLTGAPTPKICHTCVFVPYSIHPYISYSGRLLHRESNLSQRNELKLIVQNTGLRTWTQKERINIGTTRPRDRGSVCMNSNWPGKNRCGTFSEPSVAPGDKATFHFSAGSSTAFDDFFQILVEGKCWLPNTEFRLRSPIWLRIGRIIANYLKRLIA